MTPTQQRTRNLFRIGIVVVAIIAILGLILQGYNNARNTARKNSCRINLRQLGLALQSYHDEHGCLPRAYLTDANGSRTHSWRTLISPYIFYDLSTDYLAQLDLAKPWNDEANQRILKRYVGTLQCPSSAQTDSDVTHYVAVVGEGTLWPGSRSELLAMSLTANDANPSDVSENRRPRILLVEWPASDVEWTEPEDISMQRFLQWFQDGNEATQANHGDLILYLGDDFEVHELPLDAKPNDVQRLLMGEIANAKSTTN